MLCTVRDGAWQSTGTAAYRAAGGRADHVDDRAAHHLGGGEVHCGTNTLRSMATPWWGSAAG